MSTLRVISKNAGLRNIVTVVNQCVDAVNEVRQDMSAASADYQDLCTELKASVNGLKTLTDELHDDHATFRTAGGELKTSVNGAKTLTDELHDDHATFRTAVSSVQTVLGDMSLTSAGLAIGVGSKKEVLIANTVTYLIDGVFCSKTTAEVAFTATTHDIADGSERVYVLSLQANGTCTITAGTEVVGAGNAAIPSAPAGEAVIGYVRIFASGAIFNATTDDLDAAHITDTYTNVAFLTGAITAPPAALTASKFTDTSTTVPAALTASKITDTTASVPADLAASAADSLG